MKHECDSNRLIWRRSSPSLPLRVLQHGHFDDNQGHWDGPTETALYLYGYSVEEMRKLIETLMSTNPLCAKARYEKIA